jgi:predicted CopG family antitoxin
LLYTIFILYSKCVGLCIAHMPRINLTINDDNYQFLKLMKDSGKAASLSHAVRLAIQEYRRLHEKSEAGKKKRFDKR